MQAIPTGNKVEAGMITPFGVSRTFESAFNYSEFKSQWQKTIKYGSTKTPLEV